MKKYLAWAILPALCIGFGVPAKAQYTLPSADKVIAGTTFVSISESEQSLSIRKGLTFLPNNSGYAESFHCITFQEDRDVCNVRTPDMQFSAFNVLPVCENDSDMNCVVEIKFSAPSYSQQGKLIREIEGVSYPAVPALDLHKGGTASLWEVPGFEHSGGQATYAVMAFERQNYERGLGRFVTGQVQLSVLPYSTKSTNVTNREVYESKDRFGRTQVWVNGPGEDCVWFESGICAKRQDFQGDPAISLTVRYSKDVSGWFRGRVKDTQVNVKNFRNSNYEVTVTGKPALVPRFGAYATEANTPQIVKDIFPYGGGTGLLFEAGSYAYSWASEGSQKKPFQILEAFRSTVKDTAIGTSSLWSIESFSIGRGEKCFQGETGLLGIVSTNATVYDGLEPEFSNNQLSYKIAGLHYAPDGSSLNLGTYDLLMRSDVARCLYGFSKAPVNAEIQVLNENGEDTIATTVVSEKNGWLRLAAFGFTFSEKQVKVTLTQPFKKVLTKFTGKSKNLSPKQKLEIKAAVNKASTNPIFVCTAMYRSDASRDLSLARAREVCNYARSLGKKYDFEVQVQKVRSKSADMTVVISSR